MKRHLNTLAGQAVFPLALAGVLVVCWQIAVRLTNVKPFMMPGPVDVWKAALANFDGLLAATILTAAGAGAAFALSLLVGIATAFAFSQSNIIRRSCYPYAIFLQTVPIIAIAPQINNWFGNGFQSVVIVAFIVSLFPIVTNATTGMVEVDPQLLDLFRLNNATRWQILWKLRLPNAVPHLITGAKTSAGLAVIGAIVGEFFAGYGVDRHGLGYLILLNSNQMKTAHLFTAVFASTCLGIVIFATVSFVSATVFARWTTTKQ